MSLFINFTLTLIATKTLITTKTEFQRKGKFGLYLKVRIEPFHKSVLGSWKSKSCCCCPALHEGGSDLVHLRIDLKGFPITRQEGSRTDVCKLTKRQIKQKHFSELPQILIHSFLAFNDYSKMNFPPFIKAFK